MESFSEELNRQLSLSEWILKFDKHLISHPRLYELVKEYFYEGYKQCAGLRKTFHNDFLPKLESELGYPSSKEIYKYEYFFKDLDFTKFDLANFYFYNDDLNLYKNESKTDIKENNNKNKYNKYNKEENSFSERSNKEENNYIEKKKSKDNKFFKKTSKSKISSKNNFFDDEESMSNNVKETFGKQIEGTDEFSDSKEISEKSLKNLKEEKDEQKNNKYPTKYRKPYFSKKFKNIGKKDNDNGREENNNINNENSGKDNISKISNHKHSKSSYDVYKKFKFGKK